MRLGERVTLFVVDLLATWTNLFSNLFVWTGLYLWYDANRWDQGGIVWALSEWPVLVDILILSATMVLTRRQISSAERQTRLIETVSELTEGITHSLSQMWQQIKDLGSILRRHTAALNSLTKATGRLEAEIAEMRRFDAADARDLDAILAKVESLTARQEHVAGMLEAVALTMGARRREGEKDEEGGEGSA